jgi:adenylate cyclase
MVFESIEGAVRCAVKVQQQIPLYDGEQPADRAIRFRIGINVGDALADGTDIHGEVVNVAARLEAICPPGAICLTRSVRDHLRERLNLDFEALGPLSLKNIARPVEAFLLRPLSPSAPRASERAPVYGVEEALPPDDRPSIAVLAFTNLSGDPEQEYFADGIVEDLITALSRVGGFFVISRNSSFAYKGRALDLKQVARELFVRYVVEGGIRRTTKRVRISARLVEATTGRQIWGDQFDGELTDIFDLQDRMTESIVGAIAPNMRRAEIARAWAKPTHNLDAYDLYLRALERHYTLQRSASDTAIDLLKKAIAIDGDYALAKAFLAAIYVWRIVAAWDNPSDVVSTAISLARDALATSRDDPDTLRFAAHAISHLDHDYDLALATLDRAIKLNPNSAQAFNIAGWVHIHRCEPEPALDLFQRAMRLSPLDQEMGWMLWGVGFAYVMQGKTADAVAVLKRAIREMPNWPVTYRPLIYALMRSGRVEEAHKAAEHYLRLEPNFRLSTASIPFSSRAFVDEYIATLRLAGLPD